MDYDIKKGHFENVEGEKLLRIVTETFDDGKMEGDLVVASFGALERLEAKVNSKTSVSVSTKMRTDVDAATGAETIKRYNIFLEKVTGMTSKERGKRMQKKAKDGKL